MTGKILDSVDFAKIKELNEELENLISENEHKYPYARKLNQDLQAAFKRAKTLEEKQDVFVKLWKGLQKRLMAAHSDLEKESEHYIKVAGELQERQDKLKSLRAKLSDQESTEEND